MCNFLKYFIFSFIIRSTFGGAETISEWKSNNLSELLDKVKYKEEHCLIEVILVLHCRLRSANSGCIDFVVHHL
jgi:hypothetical protein